MGVQSWIVMGLVGAAVVFFLWRFFGRRGQSGCGCASGDCCRKGKNKA
jgi:uncharacterized membrane protein YeaQ/YmgE (transglycosylase-associated protein family)